jgi:LysR family hydrogen peroxide-inducible transcriptional activator
VTLVERTRRVVRFTPLGNQVVAKAHRLLREAEELSNSSSRTARRWPGNCA